MHRLILKLKTAIHHLVFKPVRQHLVETVSFYRQIRAVLHINLFDLIEVVLHYLFEESIVHTF